MKLTNVIFCDDIRQEIGNKFTLVGCYADRLRLTPREDFKWPVNLKLGVYMRVTREPSEPEIKDLTVEIWDSTDRLLSIPIIIDPTADQNRPVIIVFIAPFAFKKPGKLKAKFLFPESSKTPSFEAPLDIELEVTDESGNPVA